MNGSKTGAIVEASNFADVITSPKPLIVLFTVWASSDNGPSNSITGPKSFDIASAVRLFAAAFAPLDEDGIFGKGVERPFWKPLRSWRKPERARDLHPFSRGGAG
jgi:hypothetical protein